MIELSRNCVTHPHTCSGVDGDGSCFYCPRMITRLNSSLIACGAVTLVVLSGSVAYASATAHPAAAAHVAHADHATHASVKKYPVATVTRTFVDTTRPTPPNGTAPGRPTRTLVTTILYPAAHPGTQHPDRRHGPYPMVEFSPGAGGAPQNTITLLRHWASAGFVVVAPTFPLSGAGAPGGVNVGDVINQPADVGFVIGSVLRESASRHGPLAHLINRHEVGVSGISLGGNTTIGLVANSCCRQASPVKIKAAIVMAGTTQGYPGGQYDLTKTPPIMVVSGTADAIVPYNQALGIFNGARGPKAMVTIKGGDHGSPAGGEQPSATAVLRVTTDFLLTYLKHSKTAQKAIRCDGNKVVSVIYAPKKGSHRTLPPLPTPPLDLHATASPTTDLTNGTVVTVTWTGFTPGKDITIVQCGPENRELTDSSACDFAHGLLLRPNPTGEGSLPLVITEGAVGTSTCDATHTGCFILVDNASSNVPADNVFIPISFAG